MNRVHNVIEMGISKIVSGGQTGADRGALDAAIEMGIPHGGWIPKGRKAEDGVIPSKYSLTEMPTASYPKRTEKNVLDSEGTLILSHGKLTGGSALTVELCKDNNRPWIHVDLNLISINDAAVRVRDWIDRHDIRVLNVAGPRASKDKEIYKSTLALLKIVLSDSRM